nr:sensor histidine kinase [Roseibium litorale]
MSEIRRREKVLKVLLREVSHRSKNLLAIIQSIASQTARNSTSLDQFLTKFRGRIFSLSQSQDLVTDSNWRGAYLHDLIRDQVARYQQNDKPAVNVSGPNILLSPNAALHIGLALHELMVNAVSASHAMAAGKTIGISCKITDDGNAELSWNEPADLSPDVPPLPREITPGSFGSTVLERVVPASVSGTSRYTVYDDGVEYVLSFPLSDENVSDEAR